jgi:hypothetical protein
MATIAQEPDKKTVRKDIFLTRCELDEITEAAELQGLRASEWVRHVALTESRKKLAATRLVNVLTKERELNQ